jgi:hypothetical protein
MARWWQGLLSRWRRRASWRCARPLSSAKKPR